MSLIKVEEGYALKQKRQELGEQFVNLEFTHKEKLELYWKSQVDSYRTAYGDGMMIKMKHIGRTIAKIKPTYHNGGGVDYGYFGEEYTLVNVETRENITPKDKPKCNGCGVIKNNGLHICPRCNMVYYCNKVCQTRDWEEHKKVCRSDTLVAFTVRKQHNNPHYKEIIENERITGDYLNGWVVLK